MSALRTLVLFLFILPSLTYGEALKQTDVHFGLPFYCGQGGNSRSFCLADKYEPGITVIMVDTPDMCVARTAGPFKYDHYPEAIDATRLERADKCKMGGDIAVVGVDPKDVRNIVPKDDKSLVSKDLEKEARQILEAEPENEPWPIDDCSSTVLVVGQLKFLLFRCKNVDGAIFFLANNAIKRLEGWCTSGHVFFSVKGKLYFSYDNNCCGCGWTVRLVYDLSNGMPKQIYANGSFSAD